MKAYRFERYGGPDVLELREVEKPVPGDNEALVKIHAAALNCYDWHLMRADIFLVRFMTGGVFRPHGCKIGADISGRVEAVGAKVTQLKVGDEVFGDLAARGGGGFAEYVTAPESLLAPKPANLSFEEAAAVPMAGVTALQALRDAGQIRPGMSVLINGASGGVGTFAVQIAKAFGAVVTAVTSAGRMEMVRSLGADHVIDYAREDFTVGSRRYDLILGVNGYHPMRAYKRALESKGVYVMVGGSTRQILRGMALGKLMSEAGGRQMRALSAQMNRKDLLVLKDLIEAGRVRPVIEKAYSFGDLPAAMQKIGEGHAGGKIVVEMKGA